MKHKTCMEQVYELLDDAKAEIERLKSELRGKTDSLENFKKFQNVQKLKIEKLEQDLLQKEDEVTEANQNCEDLEANLTKKESVIKHLNAENDKLRVDRDENFKKWEDEKKELREREEDMFQKLEEENRKVVDELKWKKEQFKHLEEAHEKVREQFKSSKKEWELEKSTLFDEISSLQMKLDSQVRKSENLQSHDDIGDLRYSMKAKEAECEELKYTIGKLEQEKQELRVSLKELQEAQIQEASAAFSQSKLRSKLRNLEQIHRECASTLTAKEAEWKLKLEKLSGDRNSYRSELENKTEALEELKIELDRYKKMLEESTQCEIDSNEKLREVFDALNRTKTELDERIYEEKEIEFELQIWKSIVERLKDDLEENHAIRKELENSLLAQVDVSETLKQEKDSLIYKLCEFYTEDTQLMDMLGSIVQSFENGCPGMNLKKDYGFLTKENTKKLEAIYDVRSPFKELNN